MSEINQSEYNWQRQSVLTNENARAYDDDKVVITKLGKIRFPAATSRRFDLENYTGCNVYADFEKSKVGINLCDYSGGSDRKLVQSTDSSGVTISVKEVIKQFEIPERTVDVPVSQEDGMIVIHVSEVDA